MQFMLVNDIMPNPPEDRHAAFLMELGGALSAQEGTDNELAEILKLHLLKTKPDDNCVENAKAAILELAEDRAAPQRKRANG